MRDKAQRLLLGVILVSILALVGTVMGIVLILGAAGPPSVYTQASVPGPAVQGVTHVFIRNFAYQPANIQVVWGSAVTWTNQDSAVHSVVLPHIVTSESDIRESGPLSQGQSFSYTFLARGTFQYYCIDHPSMVGVVIVT